MKVQFLNATHRKGTSAKTGKAYDMAMVVYAVPVSPSVSEKMVYMGYGCETRELPLDARILPEFAKINVGDFVDLMVEPDPTYPSRTWVVGINQG